jgi:S1-C subfamily serine protease
MTASSIPRSAGLRTVSFRLAALRGWALALLLNVALAGGAAAEPHALAPVVGMPVQARAVQPPAPRSAGPADAKMMSAVVRIEAQAPRDAPSSATLGRARSGTGVVLDSRTVITIGYLVLESEAVDVVTQSGRQIPASLGGYDHQTGFGLVRTAIPLDAAPMELGDSDLAKERSRVLTLGQGESELTELMVLSRKTFAAGWEYLLDSPIFTFPPVNNWSGAALFTEDGKLIGIGSLVVNDAASDRAGVPGNLYVPTNLLKPILDDLRARGRRSGGAQPWFGMNTEMVRGHLMVTRVQQDGPADRAGIATGDILLAVAGERVADQAEFYRKLFARGPAGTEVTLRFLKSGDIREQPLRSIDRADFITQPRGI